MQNLIRSRAQGSTRGFVCKIFFIAVVCLVIVKTVDESLKDYNDYFKESNNAGKASAIIILKPGSDLVPEESRDHFLRNPEGDAFNSSSLFTPNLAVSGMPHNVTTADDTEDPEVTEVESDNNSTGIPNEKEETIDPSPDNVEGEGTNKSSVSAEDDADKIPKDDADKKEDDKDDPEQTNSENNGHEEGVDSEMKEDLASVDTTLEKTEVEDNSAAKSEEEKDGNLEKETEEVTADTNGAATAEDKEEVEAPASNASVEAKNEGEESKESGEEKVGDEAQTEESTPGGEVVETNEEDTKLDEDVGNAESSIVEPANEVEAEGTVDPQTSEADTEGTVDPQTSEANAQETVDPQTSEADAENSEEVGESKEESAQEKVDTEGEDVENATEIKE
jgi:hypothetical protein